MVLLCTFFVISMLWSAVLGQEPVFRVATTYTNGMVLQQGPIKKTQIWGFGSERFSEISLTVNSKTFYTSVHSDFKWFIELTPQPAGGPHNISITQTSILSNQTWTIYLQNILFGDVWVCIGEANMKFKMENIENSEENIKEALLYVDRIRIGKVIPPYYAPSFYSNNEEKEVRVFWSTLDQEAFKERESLIFLKSFSATCLLYGVQLVKLLQDRRPVGLLLIAHDSSPIEHWSSKRVTELCNTPMSTDYDKKKFNGLWNGAVYPLTKTSVRGIIWSQGESNIGYNNDLYRCHLKELFNDYKNNFYDAIPMSDNNIGFPFGIVQLGTMNSGQNEKWSKIRWAQTLGVGYLPNTGYPDFFMATSYDIADKDSPFGSVLTQNKKTSAVRLANAAGALVYNTTSEQWLRPPYATNAVRGASGFVGLTFSSNVTVSGTEGFTYCRIIPGTRDCEWSPALKFLQISGNRVGVAVPEDASILAYAWSATVCEPNNCALYSADKNCSLPVQPWSWPIGNSDKQENDADIKIV